MADVLDANKRQTKLDMNCTKVGIIRAFNPATQRAEIEIAYKQVKDILEDGTRVYQDYPVLMDCPVIVLFGGVDFLSLPIQVGDNCLVFFNDNEIDQWATNGTGSPQTFRMHDLSDAFAIVGVRPLTNAIGNYLANGIRLSHGGGNSQIDFVDNLIESIAELFLHHGDMRIDGNVTINGNLTVNGDSGGEVNMYNTTLHLHNGDIIADTISLKEHVHDGVMSGSSNTGEPVP